MLDKWWVLLFSFFIIFLLPLIRPAFWFPSTAYCQKLTMFCSRVRWTPLTSRPSCIQAPGCSQKKAASPSAVTPPGKETGVAGIVAARKMLYFFSMPLVDPLPGLVAQQKTESSPHFSQTCFTSSFAPCFPPPTTLM